MYLGVYSNCWKNMGLTLMAQLIRNIYMKLESDPRISEVTIIALKKPKAAKFSEHCAISLTVHAARTVMKKLGRHIEKKIEGVIGKDQFGCRR